MLVRILPDADTAGQAPRSVDRAPIAHGTCLAPLLFAKRPRILRSSRSLPHPHQL